MDANALGDAPDYARQNRAIGSTYEPGSTFKAFTVAAALEEGEVTPDTSFNVPPTITVADREIGEAHDAGYRTLNTRQILEQSSNVGSVMIGQRLGAERFDSLDPPLRLRQPDRRSTCRARSAASCSTSTSTPARRWATCRSARAWP